MTWCSRQYPSAGTVGGDRRQPRLLCERRANAVDDGSAGHGKPAIAQDGFEFGFLNRRLEGEKRAQLRVAILLDHENRAVRAQEFLHIAAERECPQPQVIEVKLL